MTCAQTWMDLHEVEKMSFWKVVSQLPSPVMSTNPTTMTTQATRMITRLVRPSRGADSVVLELVGISFECLLIFTYNCLTLIVIGGLQ
jgi:hypothetical protein